MCSANAVGPQDAGSGRRPTSAAYGLIDDARSYETEYAINRSRVSAPRRRFCWALAGDAACAACLLPLTSSWHGAMMRSHVQAVQATGQDCSLLSCRRHTSQPVLQHRCVQSGVRSSHELYRVDVCSQFRVLGTRITCEKTSALLSITVTVVPCTHVPLALSLLICHAWQSAWLPAAAGHQCRARVLCTNAVDSVATRRCFRLSTAVLRLYQYTQVKIANFAGRDASAQTSSQARDGGFNLHRRWTVTVTATAPSRVAPGSTLYRATGTRRKQTRC